MNNAEYIEAVHKKVCELKSLREAGRTQDNHTIDTQGAIEQRFRQAIQALDRLEGELSEDWNKPEKRSA